MRSGRERGLHERAISSGASLPCKITEKVIPMKKNPDDDDDEVELVSWPFLLPSDFVSWLQTPTLFSCFLGGLEPPKQLIKKNLRKPRVTFFSRHFKQMRLDPYWTKGI